MFQEVYTHSSSFQITEVASVFVIFSREMQQRPNGDRVSETLGSGSCLDRG